MVDGLQVKPDIRQMQMTMKATDRWSIYKQGGAPKLTSPKNVEEYGTY